MSKNNVKRAVAATAALLNICAVAHATPSKLRCSAVKNTVHHSLDVSVDGEKLTDWSYFAATPAGDSSLTCSLDSADGKETSASAGVQTYVTDAGNVTVTKKGKSFVFDFSKTRITDVCGQSSAMAKHITITPGSKHCTNVANAT
ncbi:hypothetical protein [Paraburkholderia bannensis]|uniref:hypothetical protein n=1 Tax=Paraburkholderia bannensis TaxID=765414 RepID=UPI002AB73320|nr:hypothetical protein [Paraburkholderia bannensis]